MKAYSETQINTYFALLTRGITGAAPQKMEVEIYPAARAAAIRATYEQAVVDFWIENFNGLAFTPDCVVKEDKFSVWPPTPNVKILTPTAGRFQA